MLYLNNLKNRNLDCAKAPRLTDRKRPHISNIESFTICQSRELSRQPKSDSSGCLGIHLAISPCPNDTYLFHAWIQGLVGKNLPCIPTFADIEHLNEWALEKRFPLIKLSMATLKDVLDDYQLLPVGSALGFNCGPKIIATDVFSLEQIQKKRIAIPGKKTTANLLLNHFFGEIPSKVYCLYHEISDLLRNDQADCGLIIHESRFTFEKEGFVEIADLGEMWHTKYDLPLPLGGLAIHRQFEKKNSVIDILRDSLNYARSFPDAGLSFIKEYSQEKDPKVIRQHIETYVNRETEELSVQGIQAIELLLCRESKAWL